MQVLSNAVDENGEGDVLAAAPATRAASKSVFSPASATADDVPSAAADKERRAAIKVRAVAPPPSSTPPPGGAP